MSFLFYPHILFILCVLSHSFAAMFHSVCHLLDFLYSTVPMPWNLLCVLCILFCAHLRLFRFNIFYCQLVVALLLCCKITKSHSKNDDTKLITRPFSICNDRGFFFCLSLSCLSIAVLAEFIQEHSKYVFPYFRLYAQQPVNSILSILLPKTEKNDGSNFVIVHLILIRLYIYIYRSNYYKLLLCFRLCV